MKSQENAEIPSKPEEIPSPNSIMQRWSRQPHYSFSSVSFIGNGAFGKTFKAFSSIHGAIVAVKRIPKYKLRMSREVLMLASIQSTERSPCTNVIKMLGFQYETTQPFKFKLRSTTTQSCIKKSNQRPLALKAKVTQSIILEYYPSNMELFIFRNARPIKEVEIRRIVKGILRGLAHLDSLGIAHRDLKPENILLDSKLNPVINDFGSAKRLSVNDSLIPSRLQHDTLLMTAMPYRAPQMCLGIKKYSTKVDIWSAGCIFVELLTRRLLFEVSKEGQQIVKYFQIIGPLEGKDLKVFSDKLGSKSQIFESKVLQPDAVGLRTEVRRRIKKAVISKEAIEDFLDLIEQMLQLNPDKRVSASEALHSRFCSVEQNQELQN